MATNDYNEVDILYTLMTYVNVSSTQDMYYSIAQKILTHLDLIPTISINDLASLCFTSPATISRFCKDLNCRNFAAFKKEMKLALEIAKDEIHIPEADHAELIQYPEKLVDKIYMDTINSLMQGVRNVQIEDVDHICELIHDAHRIHMYGYQFSRIIANDFQLKMLKLKKFIYSFVNRGDEIQKLETIEKGELVRVRVDVVERVRINKLTYDQKNSYSVAEGSIEKIPSVSDVENDSIVRAIIEKLNNLPNVLSLLNKSTLNLVNKTKDDKIHKQECQ